MSLETPPRLTAVNETFQPNIRPRNQRHGQEIMEATPGIEPGYRALQALA